MSTTPDNRIVMTLDAGGTNFRFFAMRGTKAVTETVAMPSNGDNLEHCLANIVEGFTRVKQQCPQPPAAISFAFPGPADYPSGIIGDLGNLPGFRGGVALGPMLEEKFGIPTFINNDGDLFVYGEAIAGFLPYVNGLLEKAGSPKRLQEPVRRDARHRLRRRHRARRRTLHRRQLGRRAKSGCSATSLPRR